MQARAAPDASAADPPNATTPPLAFDPIQLEFEQHAVGVTSSPRHALLQNYGDWPVTVPNMALDGQASSDFILATRGPLLIESGDHVPVELSFAPSAPGSRSAALSAPGDDGLGAMLLLLGIGEKAAGAESADAEKAPAAVDASAAQQPAPQVDMAASALASIQVITRTKDVLMLEPWRISEKHKKNTQQKKRLYKRLDKAKRALRTAERTFQSAAAGKDKDKALKAFEAATAEAEAASNAFRDHVIAAYWRENDIGKRARRDEAQQQAKVAALAARAKTDKSSALAAELDAARLKLSEITQLKGEIYRETEQDVEARMGLSMQERTYYTMIIDGESISIYDHVNAYATDVAKGLDGGAQREMKQGVHKSVADTLDSLSLSDSVRKILKTISENEGGFSTVNTYDRAVLTWGFMQWTGGDRSDLTKALQVIKEVAPDAFAERFQRYGIDVQRDKLIVTDTGGKISKGDDAAAAVQLNPELTAVFARAGLDEDIQGGQVQAAIRHKIDRIINATVAIQLAGKKVQIHIGDVVTSEYGVGLLADHAVRRRTLELDAYRIDQVEVSNEEYDTCARAGVCRKLPAYADGIVPVVGVTWEDAKTFCHFVGGRLPTTAEWAKAAFPMKPGQNGQGPMISPRYDLCVVLNIAGLDGEPCRTGTRHTEPYPVSTKDPDRDGSANEFDRASHGDDLVFDLFGNVAEWAEDWYAFKDYFDPPDPRNPRGPEQGTEKAICGGSFLALEGTDEGECRPMDPTQGYPDVGFRCVYDVRPGSDANAAGALDASTR